MEDTIGECVGGEKEIDPVVLEPLFLHEKSILTTDEDEKDYRVMHINL
jgi:hypothetical protein